MSKSSVAQVNKLLSWTLGSLLLGIALAATGSGVYGGVLTAAALVGTAYALHRLGRAGPA